MLAGTLQWLANQDTINVTVLRRVIGIWIWCVLLRRDLLSIAHAVFRFLERYEFGEHRLWATVQRELRFMSWSLPLCFHDLCHKSPGVIFATDAQGANSVDAGGYGAVARRTTAAQFDSAYEMACCPGLTVVKLDGTIPGGHLEGQQAARRVPFSRIPRSLLEDESQWTTVFAGRWKYEEPVVLGEGRCVLKLLVCIFYNKCYHNSIILSLQDNQAVTGSLMKGRSPAPAVNYMCRRKAGLALASGVRVILPWTETGNNPADKSSRETPFGVGSDTF